MLNIRKSTVVVIEVFDFEAGLWVAIEVGVFDGECDKSRRAF